MPGHVCCVRIELRNLGEVRALQDHELGTACDRDAPVEHHGGLRDGALREIFFGVVETCLGSDKPLFDHLCRWLGAALGVQKDSDGLAAGCVQLKKHL